MAWLRCMAAAVAPRGKVAAVAALLLFEWCVHWHSRGWWPGLVTAPGWPCGVVGSLLEAQLTGVDDPIVQGATHPAKEELTFRADAELTANDSGAGCECLFLEKGG